MIEEEAIAVIRDLADGLHRLADAIEQLLDTVDDD